MGPGPYDNAFTLGSWYDWSNPGKPKPLLTHASVVNHIKQRKAERNAREEARRRAEEADPIRQALYAKADAWAQSLVDSRRRAIEREAAEAEQAARILISELPSFARPRRTVPHKISMV